MARKVAIGQYGWIVLLASVAAALAVSNLPVGRRLDLLGCDLLMSATARPRAGTDDVAVVGIDDDDTITDKKLREEVSNLPRVFRRVYLARVLDALLDSGAAGIGLDIVLSTSVYKTCDSETDRKLKEVLRKSGTLGRPVVLGFYAGARGQRSELPNDYFLFSANRAAFLNFDNDPEEKIRAVPVSIHGKDIAGSDITVRSISSELAGLIRNEPNPKLPSRFRVDYRLAPVPRYAFWDIYSMATKMKESDKLKLREAFANKVVFVGYTFGIEDEHTVPVRTAVARDTAQASDRVYGVYIHALAFKTLLSGNLLADVQPWAVWWPAAGLALGSGILFLMLSPLRAGILLGLATLCTCTVVYELFASFLFVRIAPLAFGLFVPGAVTGVYRYGVQYRQFRYVQKFFKSYVNPHVIQQILDDPDSAFFESQRATVSVMFTDIRNFSTLSETLDPELVVSGLNRYLAEMTEAVVKVNGYMNRFVGDGILAIFGAPNNLPLDGAMSAVECGLDMLARLERLNLSEIFRGVPEIRIGIGIHTGEAIVGNIGCYQKMDYSITGDTANLASRIEGLTKRCQIPFLISGATYERVKDRVEAKFVDSTEVKGRKEMVDIYEVLSLKAGP